VYYTSVTQLVRVPALYAESRRFKSFQMYCVSMV
jgi:hypothetical protein